MSAHSIAILDTNVVLDCFVFRNPDCRPLAGALGHRLTWLSTAAMRGELEHVLRRGLGDMWPVDAAAVLGTFDRLAHLEPAPPPSRLVCTDPSDQMFIDLAVAHRAQLLTRDRALLKLARRARQHGANVVVPERWA